MEKTGKIISILRLSIAFCFVMVSLAQAEDKAKSLTSPRFAIDEEYKEQISIPQSAKITSEAREALSLEGVASAAGVYSAVVNDEIVRVGDVIRDYEILGICWQGIIVEYDGYWAWIPLEKRYD